MTIYMQCDGINGDVTNDQHKNWIQLNSVQFHLESPVYTKVGDTSDRVKGRPVIGEIEILKPTDSSSIHLMNALLNGTLISTVKIDVCHTGNGLKPHEQYVLSNVLVSGFSELQSAHFSKPLEMLRLNFTKIERTHTKYAEDGSAVSPNRVGYDLTQAKSC